MKTDNELIAEFMKLDKHPNNQRAYWIEDQDCYLTFDNLQFHKSWNQLMPVVEKIEDLGYAFEIIQYDATIFDHWSKNNLNEIIPICGETKINATYQAVVEFINWYNQQKL